MWAPERARDLFSWGGGEFEGQKGNTHSRGGTSPAESSAESMVFKQSTHVFVGGFLLWMKLWCSPILVGLDFETGFLEGPLLASPRQQIPYDDPKNWETPRPHANPSGSRPFRNILPNPKLQMLAKHALPKDLLCRHTPLCTSPRGKNTGVGSFVITLVEKPPTHRYD